MNEYHASFFLEGGKEVGTKTVARIQFLAVDDNEARKIIKDTGNALRWEGSELDLKYTFHQHDEHTL